jgi:hypothetical protein
VGQLREEFAFSEGGRCNAIFEVLDDLDLLDGDERLRVVAQMAFVDVCVGAFADFLVW